MVMRAKVPHPDECANSYPAELEHVDGDTVDHAGSPAVRARLHDLLFHRGVGNGRDRAVAAIDAYLELAPQWPPIQAAIELLPRAVDIVPRVGLDERAQRACHIATDLAERALQVDSPRPPACR